MWRYHTIYATKLPVVGRALDDITASKEKTTKRVVLVALFGISLPATALADEMSQRLKVVAATKCDRGASECVRAKYAAISMFQTRTQIQAICATSAAVGGTDACKRILEDFDDGVEVAFFGKTPDAGGR